MIITSFVASAALIGSLNASYACKKSSFRFLLASPLALGKVFPSLRPHNRRNSPSWVPSSLFAFGKVAIADNFLSTFYPSSRSSVGICDGPLESRH